MLRGQCGATAYSYTKLFVFFPAVSSQLCAFLVKIWGFEHLWCDAVSSEVLCAVQSVFKGFLPVFRFGLMLVEGSKVGGTNAHGNQVLILGQTIYITIVLNNWGSGSRRGHYSYAL